jgi:hypothetical protein
MTILGALPDGRWVAGVPKSGTSQTHQAVFLPLPEGRPVTLGLGNWILGSVHWTANDLLFASAATGYKIDSPSAALVLDPAKGTLYAVPHTQGMVDAFPSPGGGSFVVARGKHPPAWHLSACTASGHCHAAGKIPFSVSFRQVR